MTTNLQPTWGSIDDVLESIYDENGHLVANISFEEPTLANMGTFKRVLFLTKGRVTGGTGDCDCDGDDGGGTGDENDIPANINRTEVFLTEENGYSEVHSVGRIGGDYEVIGLNTERVRFSMGEDGITISKSPNLTTPGTYNTVFAFVGDDWAEIFAVQIVITVPLRVQHDSTSYTHGQTITLNLAAPNYFPQYLYVFGSRSWTITGVEAAKISVSPLSGAGYDNAWDATMITVSKPTALTVNELITTTFRILTQTQWVDVVVNIHPPVTLNFVNPRDGEVGAPGGTDSVYLYI